MRADNSLLDKRVYEFGNFRVDTGEKVLESAGRPVSIAPKALEVLIALIENRGHIVEKEDLMRKVWPETFVEDNNLAFNISVLRKLFGESGASPRYIETVPKRGYRFIGEVVEVSNMRLSAAEGHEGSLNGTSGSLKSPPEALASISIRGRAARLPAIVSAVLALTVVGLLTYLLRAAPKLTERDTIVLADFVNKTGDPVFDGTLYQGLTVQLEQSPFLASSPSGASVRPSA